MVTVKTGSWANINGVRLFITAINEKNIKGVAIEESGESHNTTVAITDIKDLSRSRKPAYLTKKLDIKQNIKFGQADYDETQQKITAVRMLVDNKIKQVI